MSRRLLWYAQQLLINGTLALFVYALLEAVKP